MSNISFNVFSLKLSNFSTSNLPDIFGVSTLELRILDVSKKYSLTDNSLVIVLGSPPFELGI